MTEATDIAIIGAGTIGVAVAYYLVTRHAAKRIVLIDPGDPMALTSAQSGENYRNWWPHPVMTAFTDHATDLLEDIAKATGNRIRMTRRGYVLATRRARPLDLIEDLRRGCGAGGEDRIRLHDSRGAYRPALSADWESAPDGVDILLDPSPIRAHFPSLADDVATILHIRRAGDISGQQLGQHMLAETLPVECLFQQKIAFEDRDRALPLVFQPGAVRRRGRDGGAAGECEQGRAEGAARKVAPARRNRAVMASSRPRSPAPGRGSSHAGIRRPGRG